MIRRRGALALVCLGSVTACGQSLFDAHREGRADAMEGEPWQCGEGCIADASRDFDGTPRGAGGRWRYLEDRRDRRWTAMTATATKMAGSDPRNVITTCAARSSAPACAAMPGALLVSAAGPSATDDPALELTAPAAQELRLHLRVFAPARGGDPTIRLYRNSREDVLFTAAATAGAVLDHELTLDALPGDRFLVAVVPTGDSGATDVGLQLSAAATGASFPSTCQLALALDRLGSSAGFATTQDEWCRRSVYATHLDSPSPEQPTQAPAPFPEQRDAVAIPFYAYLEEDGAQRPLDHSRGLTVQLWVRLRAFFTTNRAIVFSDITPATRGGLTISVDPAPTPHLQVDTGGVAAAVRAPYPAYDSWQFVRVVHTSAGIAVCLNGHRVGTSTVDLTRLATAAAPRLGKETQTGDESLFDGALDDVRVLTGALPCEP